MTSPYLNTQKLSISVEKNTAHTVLVRHFCIYFYHPCSIRIKGVYVKKGTEIFPYQLHNKIMSVLGDSISTIYGKENYTQILASNLGYELHDASILESTVTEVKGVDNAIKRYKKDMMSFKPDIVIIFLGTNDAGKKVALNKFENDYSKIINDIKKFNPNGKIFLVGPFHREDIQDSVLENYNNVIKKIAAEQNVYFIETLNWLSPNDFSDAIHPSVQSQNKIASHFQTEISTYLR